MEMTEVKITTEDIQAVMAEDPKVSLQVQVKALSRALTAAEEEVINLMEELTRLKNGKNAKEK